MDNNITNIIDKDLSELGNRILRKFGLLQPMYETDFNAYLKRIAVLHWETLKIGKGFIKLCPFYTNCKNIQEDNCDYVGILTIDAKEYNLSYLIKNNLLSSKFEELFNNN